VGALCAARPCRSPQHCAPSLHVHACAAIAPVVHLEYFHDHVRVERLLFDGVLEPRDGALRPRHVARRPRPRAPAGGRRTVRRMTGARRHLARPGATSGAGASSAA
jgi:hypothetical protein